MAVLDSLPSHTLSTAATVPAGYPVLAFAIEEQKAENWCWAAAVASVSKYFATALGGQALEQCEVAHATYPAVCPAIPAATCCGRLGVSPCPGATGDANRQGDLGSALGACQLLRSPLTNNQMTADEVEQFLATYSAPIGMRFQYEGGEAHMLVIFGMYRDGSGTAFFDIADPAKPASWHSVKAVDLSTVYGGHSGFWADTYTTARPGA